MAAPIAASLSRRHALVGLALYGLLIVLGVIGHALLMAPLQMFLHGWIGERALVLSQFVDPIVLLLAPRLVLKRFHARAV